MSRIENFLFILLILCSSLMGNNAFSQENKENILIYAMPYDFEEYSAYTASSYATVQWQSATLAGLYGRSADSNRDYAPVLAHGEPEIALIGDDMVVTVNIKPDLLFYNNEPLTASDVVFSYKLLMTPTINSNSYGYYTTYFDSNDSIVAIDDLTVEFTINRLYAFYKGLISGAIIPEDYYTDLYDAGDYNFNNPSGIDANGAGPFMVEYIDATNMEVLVERNPYWCGAYTKVDKILFKKIDTLEAVKAEFAAGTIHILDGQYVPKKTAFDNMDNVLEAFINDPSTQEMSFNFNNGWLNGSFTPLGISDSNLIDKAGKAVRKAFSHLVPRQLFIDENMEGLAAPGNMLMPSICQGWSGYETHPVREYSVDIAKSLMEEAGYDYSTDVDLNSEITSENCLFEIYMLSPSTCCARSQFAPRVETELPKIGVHIAQHLSTGWGVIAPLTFGCPTPPPPGALGVNDSDLGGWDLFFVGLSWDLDYDPSGLFDSASIRPNGDNWCTFPGDTATLNGRSWDELLEDYTSTYDFEERMKKVKLLQDFLYEWEPTACLFYPQTHWGYSSLVSGLDLVLLSISAQQWEKVGLASNADEFGSTSFIILINCTLVVLILLRKKSK